MSCVKLSLTALTIACALAFPAPNVSAAEGLQCSDISYGDPGCQAFMQQQPAQQQPAQQQQAQQIQIESLGCSDISFADSKCAAYLKPSAMKRQDTVNSSQGYLCSIPVGNAQSC